MIRAKFVVQRIEDTYNKTKMVYLHAVYSSDPDSENYSWSQHTPSGTISMAITNPAAFDQFEVGREYYVDFHKILKGNP